MISRIIPTAALLLAISSGASAQMQPSQPDAVADAVTACWQAVGPKSVDVALLGKRGWQAGSLANARGGPVNSPLSVFGKPGSNVTLMLTNLSDAPTCSVVTRVASLMDLSLAAQATKRQLTATDPQVKTARSGQSIVFLSLPKIAMLDATGTKARPGVRIVVSFQNPETK